MNLLNPIAALAALLAVPIILLYLLRLQRRDKRVSSTLLWRQVLMDREANTLWQRLRPNLLLFLQLLTLAFLIFALIRPYLNLPSRVSGRVIVLLDISASMRATDASPSRFDAARVEAGRLVGDIGSNDQMMLIAVDNSPRALTPLTSDRGQLQAALDGLSPALTSANWSAAIALARANLDNAGDNASTIVISDGANADDLSLLPGKTRYIPIGNSGDNISISTLALRRSVRGVSALVRIANTGAQADKVLVSLKADNKLVDARTLDVPAGGSASWTVNNLDSAIEEVRASIDQASHNVLPDDDVAYAVNASANSRRALLITRGNRFLEQALSAMPNLRTTRAITAPAVGDPAYDLYVLDNVTMTLPANSQAIVIGAQSILSTSGAFSNTAFVNQETHPILTSVDWRGVNVLRASRLNNPDWLRPIVQSQGGPLLYAGINPTQGGPVNRLVVLPFELRESDLPLQIAFPVLIANSVNWLAPAAGGLNTPASVRLGEVVPALEGSLILTPRGERIGVGRAGFAESTIPGIYQIQAPQGNGATVARFAVNFFNPSESQITPKPTLKIGGAETVPPAATQLTQREFWWLMAGLALLLLLVEWWIYQRGLPNFIRARR